MERAVRVPCRGLAAARLRPERSSFSDTRPLPAKSFKPHAPYSLSGAPFSGHIMTAIDRKPRSRNHPACGRFSRVSSTDLSQVDLGLDTEEAAQLAMRLGVIAFVREHGPDPGHDREGSQEQALEDERVIDVGGRCHTIPFDAGPLFTRTLARG